MKMNEYVTRAKIEDVAHSSGYAKAQSGSSFGAASSVTFRQRTSIDRMNAKIRDYRHSQIAQARANRQAEISKAANSSLEAIRQRRAEMDLSNANYAQQRHSGVATRDISGVSQSGMAGFYARSAESAPAPSHNFYDIGPK
jgi:multidrug resistance efflux pump